MKPDFMTVCQNCVNEMLGYSSLSGDPNTTYQDQNPNKSPKITNNTTNIDFFYKNWLSQQKPMVFSSFLSGYQSLVAQNQSLDITANNLYKLGSRILDIYFTTYYNNYLPTLEDTKKNSMMESLYNFGRDDDNLGIFSEYLHKTLCVNIKSYELSTNENYKKWCGCYLPEYTKTVNDINNEKINYIKENKLTPPSNTDNWLFGNQCMPYCTGIESMKIYYKDQNLGTIVGQTDSINVNNQTFDRVQCVATVCLINDISANITDSSGIHVTINQLCRCSIMDNCICIIDKNMDENNLGKIKPGLDNPIVIKQSCGEGALCAEFDESGNIINLNVCPKDNKGNPDPVLPENILPENGKFNIRHLNSIQNINFDDLWFLILLLFIVISLLYFLAAKNIKNSFIDLSDD